MREDLAGRTLDEIAKSPVGECRGRSETGDASIGVGLVNVWFSCKSANDSRILGVRLIGVALEDGKVVGTNEIQGFLDFFATGEKRPNASCSFFEGEVDCEPILRDAARGWVDGSRFSVALAVEDPCEAELVVTAEVPGPRASIVSASGRIAQPRNCEESG